MRITLEKKQATRQRIVDAALDLFQTHGFDATTTRDVAKAAGIAVGTLFNYFQTKEAIVVSLAAEAAIKAHGAFSRQAGGETVAEELFSLVAAELRQLKPLRTMLTPLLETALCPLTGGEPTEADAFRVEHLEIVSKIVRKHIAADVSPTSMHVYWSLYTGVLAFWAVDPSPKQEDTLALLDQSLQMFSAWLPGAASQPL